MAPIASTGGGGAAGGEGAAVSSGVLLCWSGSGPGRATTCRGRGTASSLGAVSRIAAVAMVSAAGLFNDIVPGADRDGDAAAAIFPGTKVSCPVVGGAAAAGSGCLPDVVFCVTPAHGLSGSAAGTAEGGVAPAACD
ncbi:MAG: hypothetical protein ACOY32_10800 [Thermodesulfobacteriota bacterium]